MAPLSMYMYPSRRASDFAMVLFPHDECPSIAITIFLSVIFAEFGTNI
jgi:hypothetical protein